MSGRLFVVATPIGNLKDVTLRALETLRDVDLVACEDTRQSRKLLAHHGIDAPTLSYHEHNEASRTPQLLDRLAAGEDVALVTDAGTPGVSDPGRHLVAAALAAGCTVVPIPGPSAAVAALSISPFSGAGWRFVGFLPARSGARRRRLEELRADPDPLVVYESPHRLHACLVDMLAVWGERGVLLGRELTKLHEEVAAAELSELVERYAGRAPRGEVVLVIAPAGPAPAPAEADPQTVRSAYRRRIDAGVDRREALRATAEEHGLSRNAVYEMLIDD